MPKGESRLGRGLSALFGDDIDGKEERVENISLDLIIRNENQPRMRFDKKSLSELSESIKEKGVIQPILLREKGDKYEIIAGERRFLAAKMANLSSIPAIIRNMEDYESAELALVENLQRENLNPIEEALAYKKLMDKFKYTQSDIAKKIGKDRATVANTLRLLNLPKEIVDMIEKNEITAGHARAILSAKDGQSQIELAKKIKSKKMSVRDAEIEAKKSSKTTYIEYENRLKSIFKNARIKTKKGKGIIEIEFKGEDELNLILKRLGL